MGIQILWELWDGAQARVFSSSFLLPLLRSF